MKGMKGLIQEGLFKIKNLKDWRKNWKSTYIFNNTKHSEEGASGYVFQNVYKRIIEEFFLEMSNMFTFIKPAKQWTSIPCGTTPLFNWSWTHSSWLFSAFILNIPSAFKQEENEITPHVLLEVQRSIQVKLGY